MDDVLEEFLAEMTETLEAVDLELVRFEADPSDRSTLDGVFRLMHTLKGTCGYVGLARLESLAHAGEDLLGLMRSGDVVPSSEAVTVMLRCVDRVKWLLTELAAGGAEPVGDDAELVGEIAAFVRGRDAESLTPEQPLFNLEPYAAADADPPASTEHEPGGSALHAGTAPGHGTIRVSVDLMESLMTMVTDLVLTRNQLLQLSRGHTDEVYFSPLQRLSAITSEVQDAVMRMRMQPIGAAWKKLPRLVRDISAELGKDIRLVTEGEAAELDRQVLELIKDPLTHMVRNAADHGLEGTEARLAAGKPAQGVIRLSAAHQAGYVVIRISDDGRGLDAGAIRCKALEKGLISAQDAEELSEAQVHRLIFAPGFSTASEVTSLSGRGVGMDVVRANIEQIGGQVDLVSTPGEGTTVTLRIPLTLAIISALIVQAGERRFAAPQVGVSEVVRVSDDGPRRIETVQDSMFLRLREVLLPVISLSSSLSLPNGSRNGFVLVMQASARRFGLLVDGVLGTEEIVVKPLPSALRDIRVLSGATVLGDGGVALILDGDALSLQAEPVDVEELEPEAQPEEFDRCKLVLFRAGPGALKAVDLAQVGRLERAPVAAIEHVGGEAVLQLRGQLTPVLGLDGAVAPLPACQAVQPLIMLSLDGASIALAVEEIVDVVEDRLEVELATDKPGVLGVAVVAGAVVEVLDTAWCAAQAARRRSADPPAPAMKRDAA